MVDQKDPVDVMVNLLSSNWNASNTDNITPTFSAVYDVKRIDLGWKGDYVLCYLVDRLPEKNSIGTASKRIIDTVSIDIRTMVSRAHLIKMRTEVERILDASLVSVGNSYDILNPDLRQLDLSNKAIKLWRWIIDAQLIKLNATR